MTQTDLVILIPILLACVGSVGLVLSRLRSMERSIAVLQTQVSPFWASIQTKVADALHQPDIQHAVTDSLLEKLVSGNLQPIEQGQLERKLQTMVTTSPTDVAEKAQVLLTVMPLVVKEKAGNLPVTDERPMKDKLVIH
jgi:DNA-binding transcriptional regulator YdaS (Cro superfamily)